jgi:hypothetical protein
LKMDGWFKWVCWNVPGFIHETYINWHSWIQSILWLCP